MKSLFAVLIVFSTPGFAAPVAILKNARNEEVGQATLTLVPSGGVRIALDLHGLPPGEHAFHVHEKGVCAAPKFDSAGGHFAPDKNPHGFDDAKGPHAGDMPNINVGSDGRLKVEIFNARLNATHGPDGLFREGGTAFIIHEKADDYRSQPAGNAGSRLACGVIKSN